MKRIAGLLMVCIPLTQVWAASGAGREAFFRCRDAKGQSFFGDSMPPQCQDVDTEVLSERGTVLRVIDGAQSRAANEQRRKAELADKKIKDDAIMRDRMLVEAYLSVKEIEALRDQRLGLVDAQIRLDEQNLGALKEREQRLLNQVQRFKPYSNQPNAVALPEHVAEEMVSVVKSSAVTRERIAAKQTEKSELQNKFASDIKRFKELKGLQ